MNDVALDIDELWEEEAMASPTQKKIGIIDDNEGEIRLLKDTLQEISLLDLRFVPFTDPHKAIKHIDEKNGYDLIYIDYNLNSTMNGLDVFHKLREINIACPIVILSISEDVINKLKGLKGVRAISKIDYTDDCHKTRLCEMTEGLIEKYDITTGISCVRHSVDKLELFQGVLKHDLDKLKTILEGITNSMLTKGDLVSITQAISERVRKDFSAMGDGDTDLTTMIKNQKRPPAQLLRMGLQIWKEDPTWGIFAKILEKVFSIGIKMFVLIVVLLGLLIVLVTQRPNLGKMAESLTSVTATQVKPSR